MKTGEAATKLLQEMDADDPYMAWSSRRANRLVETISNNTLLPINLLQDATKRSMTSGEKTKFLEGVLHKKTLDLKRALQTISAGMS
jgi:hypothetical protein